MKAWIQYGHIHKTWSWRFYCSTSPVLLICNCVALNKAIQQQLPFYGGLQYLQFEVTRIVPFTSIEIVLYTPFFVLNIILPTENIKHCSYQYIHIRNKLNQGFVQIGTLWSISTRLCKSTIIDTSFQQFVIQNSQLNWK